MIDKYEEIYARFKLYIESTSKYNAKVVKNKTNTSTHFPIVTCVLDDNKDTDNCTNDKIEFYEAHYYIINVYTKDKVVNVTKIENGEEITTKEEVASQVINDELTKLTIQFFNQLNMKRTLCKYTPNIDTNVLRRTINYQCLIGNARGNIIRR
jgi:hypothetical protein